MKKLKNNHGYSMLELLIALALTGVISIAGYRFYETMANQTVTQEEISDVQLNGRNILYEIAKTARLAGYKVGAHDPYEISTYGDSLSVYYSLDNPMDTVIFYLEDYDEDLEASFISGLPEGKIPKKLFKEVNGTASLYADYVTAVSFDTLSANVIEITLQVQTSRVDQTLERADGIRSYTYTERVTLRNL